MYRSTSGRVASGTHVNRKVSRGPLHAVSRPSTCSSVSGSNRTVAPSSTMGESGVGTSTRIREVSSSLMIQMGCQSH